MGNSISSVCCPYEGLKQKAEVLVIKEDGESIRFKDGTLVKEILSAYPHHKIIRCCSEKTVIPSETPLSCNWLYFLLPAGLALSEAAYQHLVQSTASPRLIANGGSRVTIRPVNDQERTEEVDGRHDQIAKVLPYSNGYSSMYKWKPELRPIPEIASPST